MMTGKMNPSDPAKAAAKMDDSDPGAHHHSNNNNDQEEALKSTTNNPKDNSLDQHQQTVNMSLKLLWENHLPENRKALKESQINLDKIAQYCETNYFQDDFKDEAFVLTKNYCHQALASVTSQIYSYASNIQAALNLLDEQFDMLDAQTKYIGRKLMLSREKCHRKAIGLLTIPKHNIVQPKVIFPSLTKVKTMQNIRYSREPIDLTVLDQIGVGQKIKEECDRKLKANNVQEIMPKMYKSATLRPSKSSNLSSIVIGQQHQQHPNDIDINPANNSNSNDSSTLLYGGTGQRLVNSYGTLAHNNAVSGVSALPPQLLPPNPSTNTMFGSLARNHKDYRPTKPVMMIPPPQVPSNYVSMKELNESHSATITTTTTTKTTPTPIASSTGTITQSASGSSSGSLLMLSANPHASSRKSSTVSTSTNDQDQDHGQMLPPPPSPLPSTLTSGGGVEEEEEDRSTDQPPLDHEDWIPATYLEKVIAIYDYNADKDDELSFQENSVIYVLRKNEDGWWEGIMNGITGLFPGNYVEHCM